MSAALELIAHLVSVAALLLAAGFHQVSPWWIATLAHFWQSGRRTLVLRVGRRGGKSTTLCLVAVLEALFGGHVVPAGDVGIVAIVSVSRDEAAGRLRTIEWILRALRVPFERKGDTIELPGRAVIFKTFTASIAGVSGFTAICILCDEVAKWRDADTGANPAREVIATLRPTMATVPTARMYVSSSAFSRLDFHYEIFEQGDTPAQVTAFAPTWEANPSVTQAATHELEPDERVWRREYAAIPMASICAAFEPELIDRAMRPLRQWGQASRPVMSLDPSSGHGDAFTWMLLAWNYPVVGDPIDFTTATTAGREGANELFQHDGTLKYLRDEHGRPIFVPGQEMEVRPQLVFWGLRAIDGKFYGQIRFDQIVNDMIVPDARAAGARIVVSDQHEDAPLEALFRPHHLKFVPYPASNPSKEKAVTRFRRLLAEGDIILPNDDDLRRELYAYSETVTQTGLIKYEGRGAHDDRVAPIITAFIAEQDEDAAIWSPLHAGKNKRNHFSEADMIARGMW